MTREQAIVWAGFVDLVAGTGYRLVDEVDALTSRWPTGELPERVADQVEQVLQSLDNSEVPGGAVG